MAGPGVSKNNPNARKGNVEQGERTCEICGKKAPIGQVERVLRNKTFVWKCKGGHYS